MHACRRDIHKVDRPPLQLAILERILTGGHRTTDGANADFYYIPGSARDLKKTYALQPLFSYISQTWPYWNATGGKRHIMPAEGERPAGRARRLCGGRRACSRSRGLALTQLQLQLRSQPVRRGALNPMRVHLATCMYACKRACVHAGDVGTCELPLKVRLFTEHVTWLQFWGMYDFHPHWEQTFHNRIPCMVPGRVSALLRCTPGGQAGWGRQAGGGRNRQGGRWWAIERCREGAAMQGLRIWQLYWASCFIDIGTPHMAATSCSPYAAALQLVAESLGGCGPRLTPNMP